jgi:hypothetical protein
VKFTLELPAVLQHDEYDPAALRKQVDVDHEGAGT